MLHIVVVKVEPGWTFPAGKCCLFFFSHSSASWPPTVQAPPPYWSHWNEWGDLSQPLLYFSETNTYTDFLIFLPVSPLSCLSDLKVSSHSEPSPQSLSLQQPAQPPPPPPPPPQPQYGLPVPESRDKQLCFSDFEDLSASFRSLYKCVFEQSFSQQGNCQP